MMTLSDLIARFTDEDVKATLLSYAAAADMKVTAWFKGGPADQLVTYTSKAIYAFTRVLIPLGRARFLGLATDPGDPDPITGLIDPLETPGPGWLSAKGAGDFGTPRVDTSFAKGEVTLANPSAVTYFINGPGELSFQSTVSPFKTYRNVARDGLYPLTLAASGGSATVPIEADEVGTASNAAPGAITVLVTTLPGVTVSNSEAVLGTDRESAADYRVKCSEQASVTSPNGPTEAYDYIARTARSDGTFGDSTTGVALSVNRTYVTPESVYGTVDVYYAAPAGGAAASADVNLGGATGIDFMIKKYAVPSTVTYTGHLATDQTIAITYYAYIRLADAGASVAIQAAITAAVQAFFATLPLSGFEIDPVAGGTFFVETLESLIRLAHPAIYRATVTIPAADIPLAIGTCAILGAVTAHIVTGSS